MSIDMDALANILHRGWTVELGGSPDEYTCVVSRMILVSEPGNVEIGSRDFAEFVEPTYHDASIDGTAGFWDIYVARNSPVFAVNRALELAEELDHKTGYTG